MNRKSPPDAGSQATTNCGQTEHVYTLYYIRNKANFHLEETYTKPKQSWAPPEDMQGNIAQVVCATHPILPKNFSTAPKQLQKLLTLGDTPAKNGCTKGVSLWQRCPQPWPTLLYLLNSSPVLWFFFVVKAPEPRSWQTLRRNLLLGARQATRKSRWRWWAEDERNPEEKAAWEVMSTSANLYFND